MKYDQFRGKTEELSEKMPEVDEKIDEIQGKQSVLDEVEQQEYDDDIEDAMSLIRGRLSEEDDSAQAEKQELIRQKEELKQDIQDAIEENQQAINQMRQLSDTRYGGQFAEAEQAARERIRQLESLMDDLDSVGEAGAGEGSSGTKSVGDIYRRLRMILTDPPSELAKVRQWEEKLPQIEPHIKTVTNALFGQYISPQKLNAPMGASVIYETEAEIYRQVNQKGVLGYNNGKKSHVAAGSGYELQTTVHENLHQLSSSGSKSGLLDYSTETNRQINEAVTEMFTDDTLGAAYGDRDYSAYADNRDAMQWLRQGMGKDIIAKAYFQNKPELMQQEIDGVLGAGSWDRLSKAFDDALEDNPAVRAAGCKTRDDLIGDYIRKKQIQQGGTGSWTDFLS